MNIDLSTVNYLSVVVAALSTFVVGGLWYSVLFARPWAKAAGVTDERIAKSSTPLVFGGAFLLALVAAFVLDLFIGAEATTGFALSAAFFTAIGWVIPFLGIFYLFERRSFAHFVINAAYALVAFLVMGVILGAW